MVCDRSAAGALRCLQTMHLNSQHATSSSAFSKEQIFAEPGVSSLAVKLHITVTVHTGSFSECSCSRCSTQTNTSVLNEKSSRDFIACLDNLHLYVEAESLINFPQYLNTCFITETMCVDRQKGNRTIQTTHLTVHLHYWVITR